MNKKQMNTEAPAALDALEALPQLQENKAFDPLRTILPRQEETHREAAELRDAIQEGGEAEEDIDLEYLPLHLWLDRIGRGEELETGKCVDAFAQIYGVEADSMAVKMFQCFLAGLGEGLRVAQIIFNESGK